VIPSSSLFARRQPPVNLIAPTLVPPRPERAQPFSDPDLAKPGALEPGPDSATPMWNPDEGAPLKRCLYALATVLALTSSGCGVPSRSEAARSAAGSARAGFGPVNETADIPDPCMLLTTDEVNALTGRTVTQMDEDNATPDTPTRYCQWQQD